MEKTNQSVTKTNEIEAQRFREIVVLSALRFAVFGTGFWARYQLAAWREVEGAQCVALYNRTRAKAEVMAHDFGIAAVYDEPKNC
jgi:ornithine cyclodeaminase/alanine dehydrogenase-like protein (mu-crystallin family)